jgi:hypothetical protein
MLGAICKREVLSHPFVTIHCFGWSIFFKALVARRNQTFLSLLVESGVTERAETKAPELVGRCVELELSAKRIYQLLRDKFSHDGPVNKLFHALALQEQHHAELLQLCRAALDRGRWKAKHFDPWRDAIPRLESRMREAESAVQSMSSSLDALRLAIQIESSELNEVFLGVVAASDSDFVRKLETFHKATMAHVSYIHREIPRLAPELERESQEVLNRFSAPAVR